MANPFGFRHTTNGKGSTASLYLHNRLGEGLLGLMPFPPVSLYPPMSPFVRLCHMNSAPPPRAPIRAREMVPGSGTKPPGVNVP